MIKSVFMFSKILINQKIINNIQYITVNSDLMEYRNILNDRLRKKMKTGLIILFGTL